MKQVLAILLRIGILFAASLGLPLLIGVWLPDVIAAPRNTLAEQRLTNGHSFRVIQYWNRCDFYNTELLHTRPDGTVEMNVLDGDDSKSWSVPMNVDEENKLVTVTLGGGRVKKVAY